MENTGLVFEDFYKLQGLKLSPIEHNQDFLIELVNLSHLGLEKNSNSDEFVIKITRLLEYVLRIEDSNFALLLTETIVKIQIHSKQALINNEKNIKQLCDLLIIQFNKSKVKIYDNVLKTINYTVATPRSNTFDQIIKTKIKWCDGNIFECFDFTLNLELLHTYLIFDESSCYPLLLDILVDLEYFENPMTEEQFEKLLWYGFAFDEDNFQKEQITGYETLIKSDRWGIKFFRYIMKNLKKESKLDLVKIERAINQFAKLNYYSVTEKLSL